MGKGFYISKPLAFVLLALAVGSLLTILGLSLIYAQEKRRNEENMVNNTVTTLAPYSTSIPSNEPWDKYRLPDTLLPEYYNITLWPRLTKDDLGMYIFTGKSGVAFLCVKETDLILIHSSNLNYSLTAEKHHAELMGLGGTRAPVILKTWFQDQTEFMVIQLRENLQVGKSYWLYTEFQGELADDLGGFYRSEYVENGVEKVVATTQMQPTAARTAFPCFDEPSMKAVFHLTLIHPPGTVALANGMETGTENITIENQQVLQTRFEPTEKMSTYLLAFVISEFPSIQSPLGANKILVRIWGRREAIENGEGDYALNVTFPVLKYLESYYNTTYPLSKSDQIALPDFSAGAMENWGLVTYRETFLFYEPKVSSHEDKEGVITVISHELAHMWFGNLVTMRWWNDLWLNEGFASYVSYLAADYAEPTWNIKELMVLQQVYRAFTVDALVSSHPLSSREDAVNTPQQIEELFDAVTYSKGAAVLRMLSEFLSESVFAKGLHNYLQEHAYSNTVYTDLWKKLQEVADSDGNVHLPASIEEIMNRWILQAGFPVVTIDTHTGSISQQHFLIDPEAVVNKPSDYNYEWFVPITWMKNGRNMGQHWLLNKSTSYELMKTETNWILANLNVTGYYRVNYDSQNWERLIKQLTSDHQAIPVLNRGQIIDDAFTLARAKILNITMALRTTQYLSNEKEYIPWESAIRNLEYFFLMFDRTEVRGPLEAYLRRKVEPLFHYFKVITSNWTRKPTRHMDQYNQLNAITMACKTRVKACSELTSMWYRQWMKDPNVNPVPSDLKTVVYCNAIAAGGVEEWDFGWAMFKNSTVAAEAEKLMYGLSCTKEPWLLNRYLHYAIDPNLIRKQDVTYPIVYIASNVIGQPLAWDFFRAKWQLMTTEFRVLILGIVKTFSTEFQLQQLQRFQEEVAESGVSLGTHAIEQAIEQTKANVKWVSENKVQVMDWLIQQSA
ncbi:aminopeptidase N isoform X1 [Danio rerio]|uniref:Aminopeptidase n=2 Tax=Danio rerio TaxID=7955 RepID=A0A8M1QVB8_DANRE|nr:aminopeptidase N [Danio rerio]|eukprot:XP_001922987.2 aminopeptidase N [Danio rerio]